MINVKIVIEVVAVYGLIRHTKNPYKERKKQLHKFSQRPTGILLITIVFICFTILNLYVFVKPFRINDSIILGRISAFSWTILDALVVYGLIVMAPWTKKLLILAYIISIVATVVVTAIYGNFYGAIFIIAFWSIIYLPSIRYLNKPEIEKLLLPS